MVRLPHTHGMRHIGRMRHSEITTYSWNETYREDEIC